MKTRELCQEKAESEAKPLLERNFLLLRNGGEKERKKTEVSFAFSFVRSG